jgi:tetratricopeptide (TPR) repeat protein
MGRMLWVALAACVLAGPARADPEGSEAVVTLAVEEYLLAGADAIRGGQFDDGIRLTLIGLERGPSARNRAAGLANLCAAYVSKNEPDKAIPFCNESLTINEGNWRVYSTRSQAYFLKGMYMEAARDNDAAAVLSPTAAHVRMIKSLLNERLLQPSVTIEEHH